MGAVFLAEDTVAHRQVALKFMRPDAGYALLAIILVMWFAP